MQQKHDTTARLWQTLPTDAQLERKHNRAELDKVKHIGFYSFMYFFSFTIVIYIFLKNQKGAVKF